MSYILTKTTANGYRCSCCTDNWEDTEWYDTLEEALAEIPTTSIPCTADFETTAIEIKNGATGEVVAWAKMEWSTGFGKYSGSDFTRWHGETDPITSFEIIHNKQGVAITNKTWEQCLDELRREYGERKLKEYKQEVARMVTDLKNRFGLDVVGTITLPQP